MSQRQLRLGAFLLRNGHHVAAWRHPQADLESSPFALYKRLAQTAERACFDAVFFADSLALTGNGAALEPLTLLSALAALPPPPITSLTMWRASLLRSTAFQAGVPAGIW